MIPVIELISEEEPSITIDETRKSIKVVKKCKTLGSDDIRAEIWQALVEKAVKVVWHSCNGSMEM